MSCRASFESLFMYFQTRSIPEMTCLTLHLGYFLIWTWVVILCRRQLHNYTELPDGKLLFSTTSPPLWEPTHAPDLDQMIPGVRDHPTLSSHTFKESPYYRPSPLAPSSFVSPVVDLCYLFCLVCEICACQLLTKCADWLHRYSWNDIIHSFSII